MTRHILLALVSVMALSHAACGDEKTTEGGDGMKITLKVADSAYGHSHRQQNHAGFCLPAATHADDERSVRQREVRSSAASNLNRGKTDAYLRGRKHRLLVSRP